MELSGRTPAIALGLAITALVVVGVALIVVVTRTPARTTMAVVPGALPLFEQAVRAADVVALERAGGAQLVETVIGPAGPRGLRVTDAALAPALGVAASDVITSIGGRIVRRPFDVQDAARAARTQRVTTVFVELERAGAPLVVRWRIEGSLRDAWLALRSPDAPAPGVLAAPPDVSGPDVSGPDVSGPDVSGIVRRDATHVEMPRSLLDQLIADPMVVARSARLVPAFRAGQPIGYKVFGIRPGSPLAALGLVNGDQVLAVNGEPLTDPDQLRAVITRARGAGRVRLALERNGQAQVIEITLTP